MNEKHLEEAYRQAKEARLKAYAPYSKYLVGSCFKLASKDEYIPGCNVENASFGATICAERSSIVSTLSKHGKVAFELAVIVTKDDPPAPPCALCLQVMAEFVDPDFPIFLASPEKIVKKILFKELLPMSFTKFTV